MDVSHLLRVLHLPYDLLQLALAGAVAQAPHYRPDLPDINLKICGVLMGKISIAAVTNCFVVLVVEHLEGLHHLVVQLRGEDLLPSLVLALRIKGLHGF